MGDGVAISEAVDRARSPFAEQGGITDADLEATEFKPPEYVVPHVSDKVIRLLLGYNHHVPKPRFPPPVV